VVSALTPTGNPWRGGRTPQTRTDLRSLTYADPSIDLRRIVYGRPPLDEFAEPYLDLGGQLSGTHPQGAPYGPEARQQPPQLQARPVRYPGFNLGGPRASSSLNGARYLQAVTSGAGTAPSTEEFAAL
jgi:hypothetical protein